MTQKEIEAISGIFLHEDKVLLLRRNPKRTFSPTKWDLMGGDIEEGEVPLDTLKRDALHKLNIPEFSVERIGELLVEEGTTKPIRRHLFVCRGDYSGLTIDPKKYDLFDWYRNQQVIGLDLCPGVREILRYVKFLE